MKPLKQFTIDRLAILAVACLAWLAVGCSHQAEIKNLNQYSSNIPESLAKPVKIAVNGNAHEPETRQLLRGIGNGLSARGANVSHGPQSAAVDYVADFDIQAEHAGSIANFFITFPGFLVWAPAWNGFVYKTEYDVAVKLREGGFNGQIVDSFQIPIELDIRQSEMDRTWVEISWLEYGVIALVGGIYNTTYDNDITPVISNMIERPVGGYIADAVTRKVNQHLHQQGAKHSSVSESQTPVMLMPVASR